MLLTSDDVTEMRYVVNVRKRTCNEYVTLSRYGKFHRFLAIIVHC